MWWKLTGGALGLTLIVLIALKLTGIIGVNWWIVIAPLWVPAVIAALVAIFVVVFLGNAEASGENPFQ